MVDSTKELHHIPSFRDEPQSPSVRPSNPNLENETRKKSVDPEEVYKTHENVQSNYEALVEVKNMIYL